MLTATSDIDDAPLKDYSLIGRDTALAVERGLAEADWYTSPVPKDVLRELLERRDGPALRDTALYFGLIVASGYATYAFWGTWWALAPMMIYGVLYASASDARWHEAGHGTAFKTDWLNAALYEVASFMVLRESVPWRWSHTRHHSDTIIVGRDPEIAVPRPPDLIAMLLKCFNARAFERMLTHVARHSVGRVTRRRSRVHSALRVPEGLRAGTNLCRDLPRDAGVVRVLPHLAAVRVRARAEPLRRVADGDLRVDAACGPGRERSRSPPQLPDHHDEPHSSVPVLEHELPPGTSHVPAGSVPPAAPPAHDRERRLSRRRTGA